MFVFTLAKCVYFPFNIDLWGARGLILKQDSGCNNAS